MLCPSARLGRRLSGSRLGIAAVMPIVLGILACGGPPTPRPRDLEAMVRIPAGEFIMGREGGDRDEAPQRSVWLDEFYIDRTEATNAQFKAFCDATRRIYPNNPGWDQNYFLGRPDSPVVNLTWDQASTYCAWMGKRLPTEAEWEKAARGTDGRLYPWGNAWVDSAANLHGPPFENSAPVGSLPRGASPYGVLDMAGNVWEWCADWYELGYYLTAPKRNPTGPERAAPFRVVRGGGYTSPKTDAEVANRSKNAPTQIIYHVGCRCAWSKR